MGIATATITNAEEYEKVLSTSHPVFLLFVSARCPACADTGPLFERIAARHPDIVSLVLDCANTPQHPHVKGTPTLLVYVMGELMEIIEGFDPIKDQEKTVEELFDRYVQRPLLHGRT